MCYIGFCEYSNIQNYMNIYGIWNWINIFVKLNFITNFRKNYIANPAKQELALS